MAFLISVVAGGVLMMKVKLLSANAVMTTGSGRPGSTPWVCALNALQNSMMFRPRRPSAGPIGGDGLALPAGTCSFTKPTIFFAMLYSLRVKRHAGQATSTWLPGVDDSGFDAAPSRVAQQPASRKNSGLFDLREFELDGGGTTEDRHRHADLALFVVHFFNRTIEVGERTFLDANQLADHKLDLVTRLVGAFLHLADDLLDFFFRDRCRTVLRTTHKTSDLVGVLHQVPGFIVHHHLHQHIAGEKATLGGLALAILHFHHLFGGDQNATELVLHTGTIDSLGDVALDSLLHARIGMNNIPTQIGVGGGGGHRGHRIVNSVSHYRFHPRIKS